jgi:hypothetical protein
MNENNNEVEEIIFEAQWYLYYKKPKYSLMIM